MTDPMAEVVGLLQPSVRFTKVVSGAGRWGVQRLENGSPWYCVILEGSCRMALDGAEAIALQAGDFVLVPATHSFKMTSSEAPGAAAFAKLPA